MVSRLAVAAFNTAQEHLCLYVSGRDVLTGIPAHEQGVPLPSTMVTEMLNRLHAWTTCAHKLQPKSLRVHRHLPKLATAAKSLLLQIPEAGIACNLHAFEGSDAIRVSPASVMGPACFKLFHIIDIEGARIALTLA